MLWHAKATETTFKMKINESTRQVVNNEHGWLPLRRHGSDLCVYLFICVFIYLFVYLLTFLRLHNRSSVASEAHSSPLYPLGKQAQNGSSSRGRRWEGEGGDRVRGRDRECERETKRREKER